MTIAISATPAPKPRKFGIDLSKPVLLAFAAILFVLIVMPLSWLVYYAFTDKSGGFTVANFYRLVSDADFLDPLLITFAIRTSAAVFQSPSAAKP